MRDRDVVRTKTRKKKGERATTSVDLSRARIFVAKKPRRGVVKIQFYCLWDKKSVRFNSPLSNIM
jgi:hypothetical protein